MGLSLGLQRDPAFRTEQEAQALSAELPLGTTLTTLLELGVRWYWGPQYHSLVWAFQDLHNASDPAPERPLISTPLPTHSH